ncbi:DUF2194 domain-containing protein [Oceanirhabdus sp. W0125-5]|uniref:DUF2194 domain-containing protein n=1 Tax=Oceanirhabdus sp. W0125-5 TaxID=2999116 RepID=UPI0022F30867|nr:DUF2194 domain-containing protein [Oceanirhabdus sp. W0125-5]WBW98608.1 DUF2194 domain-containing protein [Oceanirhabdus sp. W0125-5]
MMKDQHREYKVRNENYFGVAAIIILVFILMMTIINLNYFIRRNKQNLEAKSKNDLIKLEEEQDVVRKPSCLIVTGQDKNHSMEIIEESLEKAKIEYISKVTFEDIVDNELLSAEIIIINGSEFPSLGNVDMLLKYIEKGKHIIFTSMPDVDYIQTSELEEIMGIKKVTQSQYQEGVKFLPGFLLGGLLEFPEILFNEPKVELLSTTKTYVASSEESAVIWRNIYGESEIYVVNVPFFESNIGHGILSAIMAQIYPDYIYPIINAKVFTYSGLPYVSNENTSELKEIYSRNAMQLQQDIIIPEILGINKSRDLIPSGFITNNFNNYYNKEIDTFTLKQINNYEKKIYELGGELGMVYSGDLRKDIQLYKKLFKDKNLKSILLKEQDFEVMSELIDKGYLSYMDSVLGPRTVNNKTFGYLTENTVFIPFTINGVTYTDLEKLEFYADITAFGAIVQNLNLEQIIFPEGDKDNWMNVSKKYKKFIDSYRDKFNMIKARNISDTVESVKKYSNNYPSIEYFKNKIEIRFDKWYGESYFILRTTKEVESITEGTIEKIEEGAYLVTVENKEVDISLR